MTSHAPFPSARLRTARADADRLADLLATEHTAMAEFIIALAEFDSSRGWAELGHASLFAFLQRQLRLSNSAAYHRSAAARLVQRSSAVAEALRAGQLCLSSAAELAKVLTPENQAAVLPRFYGLSAREAREVVAELSPHPNPPAREVVTVVAPTRTVGMFLTSEATAAASPLEQGGLLFGGAPQHPSAPARAATVAPAASAAMPEPPTDAAVPLTADLRRLHVTVSRRFLEKLEAAKEARAHARPGATTEALLEEALDLLLAKEEKRRTAATTRPLLPAKGAGRGSAEVASTLEAPPHRAERDHVPAQVRREVWARDEGRCQWPVEGGGICGSTHRLQLDHTRAVARGGEASAANLRVLCEAHNKEAARRTLGARWMARFGGAGRRRAG